MLDFSKIICRQSSFLILEITKEYTLRPLHLETNKMKAIMPADGPVNVNRYTLYAMVPGLDTYAVSKIDKKKPASIITIISIVALMGFTGIIMYQMITDPALTPEMDKELRAEMVYEKYMPQMISVILGFLVIYLPIITYLVHKWAKEWNENFEK